MSYKRYLIVFLSCVFLFLASSVFINYTIDPAGIYRSRLSSERGAINYTDHLLLSENGLYWFESKWNERDIKRSLGQKEMVSDCVIIGSSRAMQISSFRGQKSLQKKCSDIMNLAVSGAGLEDYYSLSYEIIMRKQKPKKIVFGIDLWSFDLYRDLRWERYEDGYVKMKSLVYSGVRLERNVHSLNSNYLTNLINFDYLVRSLRQIKSNKNKIKKVQAINYFEGNEDPIILPDGSLVYSNRYMLKKANKKIPVGGIDYKIKKGGQISKQGIQKFSDLVRYINSMGVAVVFMMTPYHPNIWRDDKSNTLKAIREVEPRILALAKKLNVDVFGSYDPAYIGCFAHEFYDHMHPKASCISKISY